MIFLVARPPLYDAAIGPKNLTLDSSAVGTGEEGDGDHRSPVKSRTSISRCNSPRRSVRSRRLCRRGVVVFRPATRPCRNARSGAGRHPAAPPCDPERPQAYPRGSIDGGPGDPLYRAKRAARSTDHVRSIPRLRKARRARQGTGRRPLLRTLRESGRRLGALQATARALREQSVEIKGSKALLSMNQPDGFDCPGCAWPDPKHTSSFEFCENGAKAVSFELTSATVTREFFAAHTVSELAQHSDYWLEEQGRLTEPMRYDARDRPLRADQLGGGLRPHRRGISRADRSRHGRFLHLRPRLATRPPSSISSSSAASARTISPIAPTCATRRPASACLRASASARERSCSRISITADAIFVIGQNPGTNSPRMMTSLRNASRRGVPIVAINPLRERALERFAAPQSPVEMVTLSSTPHRQRILPGQRRRRRRGAEGHDEAGDRGARGGVKTVASPCWTCAFIEQHTVGPRRAD